MSDKNAAEVEIQYGELRKTFNANLRANCSTCPNVQCCDNENLSTGSLPPVTRVPHPEVGQEMAALEPEQVYKSNKYLDGQQLTSAGLRKLSKNWETCLCRIQVLRHYHPNIFQNNLQIPLRFSIGCMPDQPTQMVLSRFDSVD